MEVQDYYASKKQTASTGFGVFIDRHFRRDGGDAEKETAMANKILTSASPGLFEKSSTSNMLVYNIKKAIGNKFINIHANSLDYFVVPELYEDIQWYFSIPEKIYVRFVDTGNGTEMGIELLPVDNARHPYPHSRSNDYTCMGSWSMRNIKEIGAKQAIKNIFFSINTDSLLNQSSNCNFIFSYKGIDYTKNDINNAPDEILIKPTFVAK